MQKGGVAMVALTKRENKLKNTPKVNDEFDKYLTERCTKTTFNGSEIAAFSWYKKTLGLENQN